MRPSASKSKLKKEFVCCASSWQVSRKPYHREKKPIKIPYLINTLEARLVELQLKEKELLTKYTDQSRLVQNVKEEIRVVEQKLEEQSTKRYGRRTSGVNPTHQRLKEELFRNEAELEALKAKKITQKEHLDELQVKLENLNQVELELQAARAGDRGGPGKLPSLLIQSRRIQNI